MRSMSGSRARLDCRHATYTAFALPPPGWAARAWASPRRISPKHNTVAPVPRPLQDDLVKQARARLFGSWEMNWMAYNYAQDVTLPGSSGSPVHFLMYPQAETAEGRLDSLDPDHFRYQIASRETTLPGN